MILSCNSCEKKFVVPDNAITASGRLVQCSSCGNKWKQFPIKVKEEIREQSPEMKLEPKKVIKPKKIKKQNKRKKSGPNLYSPEYLEKKHGIKIQEKSLANNKKTAQENKIGFGFYNYLLTSTVIIIFILKILYFMQGKIIEILPQSEIYIEYLFETIRNIKVIIQNFFFS